MSNTNISDIAIKLSVNADGVSKGFRTAAEEARSYKAELDRLVYAVGKNDPVDYNAHVQQFMQVTNERLAREKKAQEEFNAWYQKEMDKEVAAFIAAETQKEQATQARIATERQAALYTHNMQQIVQVRPLPAESESRGIELRNLEEAIRRRYALLDQEQQLIQNQVAMNTRNAQRFQATLEMETTARAQANAQLQAAITARYALLDTEERALRDNAANAAAADARKVAAAEQIRQQELASLRTFIQQKYALLDQEERAVRDNATNAAAAQARAAAQTEQSHQQDLANLRTYIQQKYALLDQEERAIRDNAANLAAAQALAVRNAQQTHEQDLQNLREYITQKYAILNREEAIEKMNASNAAEIARLKTMRTKQAQDAANAQRDADFAAYKADLARQEAAAAANAERMNRIERARQRDAKRAADDDRVRQLNDWRMQQAMIQRAQVDTALRVSNAAGGFGGAAMAIGQASYAAEDFIQVLTMGGGLNMALMSASNNLSMVIRALLGTGAVMSAIAGVAVPAVLIGFGAFIRHMMETEEQANATSEALRKIAEDFDRVRDANRRAAQQEALLRSIKDADSVNAIENIRNQQQEEMNRLLEEEKALQAELARLRKEAEHAAGQGVPLDTLLQDIRNRMERAAQSTGDNPEELIRREQARLKTAYENLQTALAAGNEGDIIVSARAYRDVLNDQVDLFGLLGESATKHALARVNALLAEENALASLKEAYGEEAEIKEIIADREKALEESKLRHIQLMEEAAKAERQRLQMIQDEIRFRMTANDLQRDQIDIQKQLSEFLGIAGPNPMQGMDFNDMSAAQVTQSKEFLEMMWRSLKQQREDILNEQRKVTPTGGLEQDVLQAQADAFKQMMEAQNKEDPQLASIDRKMSQINVFLEEITRIPGFQIVQ